MKAIERSDVCLLVINAEEGIIEHDKHIASYALEEGKPIIIVVNKWDTVNDKNDISTFTKLVRSEFQIFIFCPNNIRISTNQEKNIILLCQK